MLPHITEEESCISTLAEVAKAEIMAAIAATKGNKARASILLGVSVVFLRYKLRRYRAEDAATEARAAR